LHTKHHSAFSVYIAWSFLLGGVGKRESQRRNKDLEMKKTICGALLWFCTVSVGGLMMMPGRGSGVSEQVVWCSYVVVVVGLDTRF